MPLPAAPKGSRARIYNAALRLFAENGGNAITVSELADAAGIARGTIYNNVEQPENLFGEVASSLSLEMIARVEATLGEMPDPVQRLATGIRLFVRRAHEERDWGRFLVHFGISNALLRGLMDEPPARDILRAIESGRFKVDQSRAPALVSMLTGSTLAAMNAVLRGDQTWRDAGACTAELFMRAGGVPAVEARRIANMELPPLAQAKPARKDRRKAS